MRRHPIHIAALAIAALVPATTALAQAPRASRYAMARLEAQIDGAFALGPAPFDILGNTRGVYLVGYGAIFTTMVSPPTPIPTPFRELNLKDIMEIHDRKLHLVPALREKMRDTMVTMAESPALDSVHLNEQIVCGVTLFYFKWEDTAGLPSQIVMQAAKGKLLDLKSGRTPRSQIDSVIKTQEL